MRYTAAIFDMDGTVLDTVGDLTDSLNYVMRKLGHKSDYTTDEAKCFFGSGVGVAVTRALAVEAGHSLDELEQVGTDHDEITPTISSAEVERVVELFRPHYAEHCDIKTGAYPGIMDLLADLKLAGVACAVVSNKPDPAVQRLAAEIFDGMFDLSVGEQEGLRRKPAPDMVRRALAGLGVIPEQSVYIGDSEIDLQTAENSGMDCIAVAWGFRGESFLAEHGAQMIVHEASEVGDIILGS